MSRSGAGDIGRLAPSLGVVMAAARAVALAGALAVGAPAAQPVLAADPLPDAYDAALREGRTGTVAGRVYAERRRPSEEDRPLAGAVVHLMPRSGTLLAELERLRGTARSSAETWRHTAPRMRRAREAYERRLGDAGAAHLVLTTRVDDRGAFRFDRVPAGAWVLFAWHEEIAGTVGRRAPERERRQHTLDPRLVGVRWITIWVREVAVEPGGSHPLDLHDRNGWFRGVAEQEAADTGRAP